MKKLIMLAVCLVAACTVSAQNWQDALKSAATDAVDKATDGSLTAAAMVGTWHYSKPGVKVESDNLLASAGAAAMVAPIQEKLDKAYQLAGIKPGACTFVFAEDKSFTASVAGHDLKGTYDYDASSHVATLHFGKGKIDLGSVSGRAYIHGENLQLVFPIQKLAELVSKLGQKVDALSQVSALLEKYKDIYLGFEFSK